MKTMNLVKRYGAKAGAVALPLAVSGQALANDALTKIGTDAATEIAKFTVMVSAIGMAVLSVVVVVQGFKIAFGMIKAR